MTGNDRCVKLVSGDGWGQPYRCKRAATVTIGGKGYCTQHDPDRVTARRETADRTRREYQTWLNDMQRSNTAMRNAGADIIHGAMAWEAGEGDHGVVVSACRRLRALRSDHDAIVARRPVAP